MTRIVAGVAGGRALQVPPKGTRPTSERVREALFSRLEHLDVVDDAVVLDLFAGSGALGLEAASRGARAVTLVEGARPAAEVCRRNVAATGLGGRVSVVLDRVERFVQRVPVEPWDLVLVDPPYDLSEELLGDVLRAVLPGLREGAVVMVERSTRTPEPTWPDGLVRFDDRGYGETRVWFAEPAEPASGSPSGR
ncbi:RsmD family RNA methyltransferase [Cellulomonas soli]|uniref:Methyltransferase n=1 Tax=Cellulomonas soli TaxID=931535 RepID=A0A512PDP3_9CELL|nr:RsmD family RNA methyltransferase [Cellulomonas soli]NYI60028.1 16S rRNA (guanine966-N2)-methyltransferase [Cellulomonas soli]GEP69318.1 methyltransferase [Cellulomonas soli]